MVRADQHNPDEAEPRGCAEPLSDVLWMLVLSRDGTQVNLDLSRSTCSYVFGVSLAIPGFGNLASPLG